MATDDENSLGGEATFASNAGRPQRPDVSLGDERTIGGGVAVGTDTVFDDIELVDLQARYKFEGPLGEGGMGAVMLATDGRLGRKVAIKRILGESARSKAAITRFLTEARAIAAINHPNVVQIYELGVTKDGPFLIMEYVDGSSLLDRCRDGALPLEQAVDLACQLCDGLAKAHDLGIVHRDIKPANILLTKDGLPKLTDFGLAKAEATDHQMTMTGAVLGTPDFMPPEQRRDAAFVDHRSDLWSLAATLYQAVSGRSPRVIRLYELPPALQPIIGKALEDEKAARYQSAKEFRVALIDATGGKGATPKASAQPPIIEEVLKEGWCTACGTIASDLTRKFCRNPKCGASLRMACLKCESQIPVWDSVCGECGGNQPAIAESLRKDAVQHIVATLNMFIVPLKVSQQLSEAHWHISAWDYPAAIQAIESIPAPLRDAATSRLLEQCSERRRESVELIATIASRMRRNEIDGLLPIVERAIALRGDRLDLAKIRVQLAERLEGRISRARAAIAAGDAAAAAKALGGAAVEDLGEEAHLLDSVTRAAAAEERLLAYVKDAKADGVVSVDEARSILKAGEQYLAVNPASEKAKLLIKQANGIVARDARQRARDARKRLQKQLVRARAGKASVAETLELPPIRNSIGIELKLLPAGTFTMGQAGGDSDETPHQVTLTKPFYLGVCEVTNAQWMAVMGFVPSQWKEANRPVEQVSWEEATEFCRKLSALPEERWARRVYRLPTEAEWEYACRAGTKTAYCFGDDWSGLGDFGWFAGNAGGATHPVGQKKPNAWGLFDMIGNVWEWCSDWYGEYPNGVISDPQGPSWGSDRVFRGGGWRRTAGHCRSAFRNGHIPSLRSDGLGFRLALSPPGAELPEAGK